MQREYLHGGMDAPFDREQARRFADFSGVLIVALDRRGCVSLANRTACSLLEVDCEEDIVGSDWFARFVPERFRVGMRDVFDRLLDGTVEAVEFFENPVLTAGGAERMVQWHNTTIRDDRGRMVGTLSSGIDITARSERQREAQAHWAHLDAFFSTAADGLLTIDSRGTIETANPACVRMFEYSLEELIGQNVRMLMPSPDRERHDEYIAGYVRTGEKKIIGSGREVLARRKSGTVFPVFLAVSEMQVDGERKFAGIVRDMTDLKNAQQALLKQESLARVGELASVVAHEVRNPLAGIGGALRVLQGRVRMSADEREVIDEILARLDQLGRTVDDLLVFARPRMPHRKAVPLSVLLEETIAFLAEAPVFREIRVELDCPERIVVAADAEMLKPVFQNIFLNAAQAMEGRGELRVEARSDPGASSATIRVTDTGPGIPAEHREKVFQPFFSTKCSGTGLGLSIASRAIELHDGAISIEPPEGGGAVVAIRLPLSSDVPKRE